MRHVLIILFLGITTAFFSQESSSIRKKQFNLEYNLALKGYDPVAYFKQKKAVKGSDKHVASYQGVKYHFSSEANKKTFEADPSKYEPQYGGWCAYAMGDSGKKVEVDPETFKIVDGKLYLFYNAYFNNTLNSWNKDEKNLKSKAYKNWAKYI